MLLYKKFGLRTYGFMIQKYRKHLGKWRHLHVKTLSGEITRSPIPS